MAQPGSAPSYRAHRAFYNDGRTAKRHEVDCEIVGETLEIRGEGNVLLDRWPLVLIRYVEGPKHRRFRVVDRHARLTLLDADKGAWLTGACPNLAGKRDHAVRWPLWTAVSLAAAISVAGIFLYLIPSFSSMVVRLVPYGFERRIGVETRDQILTFLEKRGGSRVCASPMAMGILQKQAREIATVMGSPFEIDITVLRFPVANAFALPGGQMVILSELIEKAKDPNELVGVLAHEIAHTVRRDPLQVSIKQTGTALLVSLVIGDVFGGTALTGVASTLAQGGYSRDAEAAADAMAVIALNQLDLSARPLAEFLARMDKEEGAAGIPSFLSTHPSGADRQAAIERLSQGLGRALTPFEWRRIKGMCDKP